MESAHIQRWAITLSAYSYTIEYKPSSCNSNVAAFSRLPLLHQPKVVPTPADTIFLLDYLYSTPVTTTLIKQWTQTDPILFKVRARLMRGWNYSSSNLQSYFRMRSELSVEAGCVLRGNKVLVPLEGHAKVLELLHEAHPGVDCIKCLAREYIWWTIIDCDIERRVKSCNACQMNRKSPEAGSLQPWEWPDKSWSQVHVDYAGPFLNRMFLIIVDAHSTWLGVHVSTSSTASVTIQKLRDTFSTLGLPETLVSDNGSVFTGYEFQEFKKQNGIRHLKTVPYHPVSNGKTERAVQTFKSAIKRMQGEESLESKVS